jgi:hypothetical protein
MKPLFARFLPVIVSEQPISSEEDGRTCRILTGLHLLSGSTDDDVEKAQGNGRRATLVEMHGFSPRDTTAKEMKKLRKGLGNSKRKHCVAYRRRDVAFAMTYVNVEASYITPLPLCYCAQQR